LWERKKNTKISGQKLLGTSICVKILKQKNQKKNIKRNPKIKVGAKLWEDKKIANNVIE